MAEEQNIIDKKIHQFVFELKKIGINVEKAILFGSYAKGTNNEWSDIDLVVVSNDFKGIRIIDKENMVSAISAVDYDISPLPYRPEDFTEDDLFVKEIIKTGIRIV
ncbi:MAG: nucleotidyltransferase domain-containing protein [Bacteroidetes bacterium]|nr:nucleotidyltransferase domain-containing protein [Bacteroidota bacterium]MCL6099627.1 nucleotidyltransferase domain-containing protein [Bacteroidota bacterium]